MKTQDKLKQLEKEIKKLKIAQKPQSILDKLGENKDIMGFAEIAALFGTIKLIHSVGD